MNVLLLNTACGPVMDAGGIFRDGAQESQEGLMHNS